MIARRKTRALVRTALLVTALSLAVAVAPAIAGGAPLPAWPDDFGPEVRVALSDHATSYSAVLGPDGLAWCFYTERAGGAAREASGSDVSFVRVGRDGSPSAEVTVARTDAPVTDLAVAADSSRAVVAWIEKAGNEYSLRASFIDRTADGSFQAKPPVALLHVGSVLSEVSVGLSGDRTVFAWIDQEQRRPAAFVGTAEELLGGWILPRQRVSETGSVAQQVRVAANSNGTWLSWVEAGEVSSIIKCASYIGSLGPVLTVGPGGLDEYGAVLLPNAGNSAAVVFTRGRVVRGEMSSSVVAYGRVSADGRWLTEPWDVGTGEGFALTPAIAITPAGPAVIWAEEQAGLVGVRWAQIANAAAPGISRSSAVSLSSKDCLHPQLLTLADGTQLAFYEKFESESEIAVLAVSSTNSRPPDWRYFLGLDPSGPVRDALFSLVMALVAALAAVALSFPLITLAVALVAIADRLRIFSESRVGELLRSLFLFTALFAMKTPGKWFNRYLPALPSGLAWLSFLTAAAATLLVTRKARLSSREWMLTALSATIFLLFDALFAVIQRGVTTL